MTRLRATAAAMLALVIGACNVVDKITDTPGLSIRHFSAIPSEIAAGGSALLDWSIEGAESTEIDHGVGAVTARGSRTVRPAATTTYTLTARAGNATSTATVTIVVTGTTPVATASPSPTPAPTTAQPTATPVPGAATPTPTGTPAATPTATFTPAPTATPAAVTCGSSASSPSGCTLTISKPTALGTNQCIELNLVTVNQQCPVGAGTTRSLRFDVTAHTTRTGLTWRRHMTSSDILNPSTGAISSNGTTSVLVSDIVLDSTVTLEIVDGSTVLLSFTLRHF